MLAVGNIIYAILMAGYLHTGTADASIRVWTWAKAVEGVAYFAFWLRPELSPTFALLIPNGLLIAAAVGQTISYCMALGYRWRPWLIVLAVVAELLLAGAVMMQVSLPQLAVLMSLIIAVLCGLAAFILLRDWSKLVLLRCVIGIPNLLISVAFLARAWVGANGGTLTVFTPSPTQTMVYLGGYLLLIVNGLGFLLLSKQKDERQLHALATTDSLTGLINRHAFMQEAERARAQAKRSGRPLALMVVDIDHFKQFNDRHGHALGDQALRMFVEATGQTLRAHDLMGRLGGEEFAVLLPGTAILEAMDTAERLRHTAAAAAGGVTDRSYSMTVSIGVAQLLDAETVGEALVRADRALHRAKRNGRNRVEAHAVHLAPFTPDGLGAAPGASSSD
ncbi:GGDEF domain-containing protein [Massilia niabensis]|uniref:diguanylate cyclase n=1 Tax=Massilia niabensis TaxID=544910 RepID=A0ABW0LCH5_9BURK